MIDKQCRKCGKFKPPTEYYKQDATRDGLGVYCRQCVKASSTKSSNRMMDQPSREFMRSLVAQGRKNVSWNPTTIVAALDYWGIRSDGHTLEGEFIHWMPFLYRGKLVPAGRVNIGVMTRGLPPAAVGKMAKIDARAQYEDNQEV